LAGFLVAAAGFLAVAFGNRVVFGVWGGIGGWYLWNWAPWLWLACQEVGDGWQAQRLWLMALVGGLVLGVNAFWWAAALHTY
jgi:hypothetical protein